MDHLDIFHRVAYRFYWAVGPLRNGLVRWLLGGAVSV
jgi:hypothetical protein